MLIGSAVLFAWKGLVFSPIPAQSGNDMRLQYRDITIDVGWTDDLVEAAKWVEDVNRFLDTKRGVAEANGKLISPALAGSTVC